MPFITRNPASFYVRVGKGVSACRRPRARLPLYNGQNAVAQRMCVPGRTGSFRRRAVFMRVLLGIAAAAFVHVALAQSNVDPQRAAYADSIRQTYKYTFGPGNMSLPGNAAVEGNTFLPASAFPKAEYCGHCHKEAYAQWRQALHSNSFRTPFYRTSVNILAR